MEEVSIGELALKWLISEYGSDIKTMDDVFTSKRARDEYYAFIAGFKECERLLTETEASEYCRSSD